MREGRGVDVMTLKQARLRRRLTLRALAATAGVAFSNVTAIEAGRQQPRFATIEKLAAALEVAPEQITEFRIAMGLTDDER